MHEKPYIVETHALIHTVSRAIVSVYSYTILVQYCHMYT
jgi:hypothetical protein